MYESQETHASHPAVACKLPLLDGHFDAATPVISTERQFERIGKLQKPRNQDLLYLEAVLSTAWALLLRCYTGQDDVCFYIKRSGGSASVQAPNSLQQGQEIVRLACHENESLADHIHQVREGITLAEQRAISASPNKKSVPDLQNCNTTICFHENDSLQDLQDTNVASVSINYDVKTVNRICSNELCREDLYFSSRFSPKSRNLRYDLRALTRPRVILTALQAPWRNLWIL